MRTYEEAFAAAREVRAFANGTEGHAWTDRWCDRCIHDQSARNDQVKPDPANNGLLGCALLAVALMGRTPAEWLEQPWPWALGDTYHCVDFRNEDDPGPGYEPTPEPPPPGQLPLFDDEPYRGYRMYADVVAAARSTVEADNG